MIEGNQYIHQNSGSRFAQQANAKIQNYSGSRIIRETFLTALMWTFGRESRAKVAVKFGWIASLRERRRCPDLIAIIQFARQQRMRVRGWLLDAVTWTHNMRVKNKWISAGGNNSLRNLKTAIQSNTAEIAFCTVHMLDGSNVDMFARREQKVDKIWTWHASVDARLTTFLQGFFVHDQFLFAWYIPATVLGNFCIPGQSAWVPSLRV